MTSSWPEEPGYHWVTHNDSTVNHLAKAASAMNEDVPDTATAQVHAILAQAEATLVIVHTLRDIMGRLYEQTVAMDNLRRTIAGFDGGDDDPRNGNSLVFGRQTDLSSED
jgi:hypothetical protein